MNSRGFDEFFGHLTGGHRYLPEELTFKDETEVKAHNQAYRTKILRNNTRVEIDDYLTDEFSDEAVKFIENNSDNPFFCTYPTMHLMVRFRHQMNMSIGSQILKIH